MKILQTAFSQPSAQERGPACLHSTATRAIGFRLLLGLTALLTSVDLAEAQSILNTNLIVNGNAETGQAGAGVVTAVASIPGWTVQSGKPTVLPYNLTSTAAQQPSNGYEQLTQPSPPDHGFQYFAAAYPSTPAVMSQVINVSAASSLINAGNAEFVASAYMGSAGGTSVGTQMAIAFQNASGQTFNTIPVGPAFPSFQRSGMFLYQQIGLSARRHGADYRELDASGCKLRYRNRGQSFADIDASRVIADARQEPCREPGCRSRAERRASRRHALCSRMVHHAAGRICLSIWRNGFYLGASSGTGGPWDKSFLRMDRYRGSLPGY